MQKSAEIPKQKPQAKTLAPTEERGLREHGEIRRNAHKRQFSV